MVVFLLGKNRRAARAREAPAALALQLAALQRFFPHPLQKWVASRIPHTSQIIGRMAPQRARHLGAPLGKAQQSQSFER